MTKLAKLKKKCHPTALRKFQSLNHIQADTEGCLWVHPHDPPTTDQHGIGTTSF